MRLRQAAFDDLQNRRSLPNTATTTTTASTHTSKPSSAGAAAVHRAASNTKKFNSISESTSRKAEKPKVAVRSSSSCDTTAPSSSSLFNGNRADMPPVVMFDDGSMAKSNATTSSPSFTFGFFDDVSSKQPISTPLSGDSVDSAPPKANVSKHTVPDNKTSPSTIASEPIVVTANATSCAAPVSSQAGASHGSAPNPLHATSFDSATAIRMCRSDVDLKTFNYDEILFFIRQAWESTIRSDMPLIHPINLS